VDYLVGRMKFIKSLLWLPLQKKSLREWKKILNEERGEGEPEIVDEERVEEVKIKEEEEEEKTAEKVENKEEEKEKEEKAAKGIDEQEVDEDEEKENQIKDAIEILAKVEEKKRNIAVKTLLIYIGNVLKNQEEEKYKKIGIKNKAFISRVGSVKEAYDLLLVIGWKEGVAKDFLVLTDTSLACLELASALLTSMLA